MYIGIFVTNGATDVNSAVSFTKKIRLSDWYQKPMSQEIRNQTLTRFKCGSCEV